MLNYFCNFYQRFIQDFSKLAKFFTSLTKKDISFELSSVCQSAYNNFKKWLLNRQYWPIINEVLKPLWKQIYPIMLVIEYFFN